MARTGWFETVAEAQRRAEKRLPKSVYSALLAGSERGISDDDNVAAFGELGFAPHVADLSATRDQSTHVMGQDISLPVIISPDRGAGRAPRRRGRGRAGRRRTWHGGRPELVREQAGRGGRRGQPADLLPDVLDGSRDTMVRRMDRARDAGAVGLIVTLDWSFSHGRDWGSPSIPDKIDMRTMARFAPEVARRPRWLLDFARTRRLPDLSVPNVVGRGETPPTFFGAYGEWMQTPPPSWKDVAWLREEWGGPFMVKGISRVDDALAARDAGVTTLSVSNHGGNNIDGTPAPIRVLSSIATAVGHDVEVVMDGGIRRGSDVVKALALGARAVMIGRAYLWGLAANGQAGVENVLDILRSGIDSTLLALGHSDTDQITRDDVLVPDGFTRVLGQPPA